MKNFSIFILLLLFGTFLSCETEIQFTGKVTEPVLVVNAVACADSIIHASVSLSRFFLDQEESLPDVTNATVALFVNGTFKENLQHVSKGNYCSHYISGQGDVIRLNVSAPDYESVWSETSIPSATSDFQIDSTTAISDTSLIINQIYDGQYGYIGPGTPYHNDTIGITFDYTHSFEVRFSNPLHIENYYRLVIYYNVVSNGYSSYSEYKNDVEDIVFGSGKNNLDGLFEETGYDPYNVFSDELIDGTMHTLKFKYKQNIIRYGNRTYDSSSSNNYERILSIDLQSISKEYYLYLKSLKALGLADPFMSEPVQVFTNVENGLGVFGAYTHQLRKITLPK
ncbi:MAG TPA: DUF4249 domain-containing protein [Bacteroidales bacterium]|nr:DUF4249 domain-containing protein [Bacteroidales bacterium]